MLLEFKLKAWTQTKSLSMSCCREVSPLWERCTWRSAASALSLIYCDCLHGFRDACSAGGLQLDPFRLAGSDSSGRTTGWRGWAQEWAGGGLGLSVLRQHRYKLNLTSEKLWETFSAFLNLWSLPPRPSSNPLQLLDMYHKLCHQYAYFL